MTEFEYPQDDTSATGCCSADYAPEPIVDYAPAPAPVVEYAPAPELVVDYAPQPAVSAVADTGSQFPVDANGSLVISSDPVAAPVTGGGDAVDAMLADAQAQLNNRADALSSYQVDAMLADAQAQIDVTNTVPVMPAGTYNPYDATGQLHDLDTQLRATGLNMVSPHSLYVATNQPTSYGTLELVPSGESPS